MDRSPEEHILSTRVYHADTDAGGVMHHCAYLRLLEQARTEALRAAGVELHVLFQKYGILLAIKNIAISYIKPARLDDLLFIKTKVNTKRKASVTYEQLIYLDKLNSNIICSAEIMVVCVNKDMKPCLLPSIFNSI